MMIISWPYTGNGGLFEWDGGYDEPDQVQCKQPLFSLITDADNDVGYGDDRGDCEILQENGKESFEELQQLFEEMFQRDGDGFNSAPHHHPMNSFPTSASPSSYCESSNASNKRNSAEMSSGMRMGAGDSSAFEAHFQNFCFGVGPFHWFNQSLSVYGLRARLTLHVCVNGEDR